MENLPVELFFELCGELTLKDVIHLSETSKKCNKMYVNAREQLFEVLCNREILADAFATYGTSFYERYRDKVYPKYFTALEYDIATKTVVPWNFKQALLQKCKNIDSCLDGGLEWISKQTKFFFIVQGKEKDIIILYTRQNILYAQMQIARKGYKNDMPCYPHAPMPYQ